MNKKRVAVLFGGQSSEHEISCTSAITIISNINKEQYDILLVGITKKGQWLKVSSTEDIISGTWRKGKTRAVISPDATQKAVLFIRGNEVVLEPIDVVFPVLHGLYGEDGTVQGLLELAKIPYVGCGVASSAISMDKLFTKVVVKGLGIPQAKYIPVYRQELLENSKESYADITARIEQAIGYPMFVKPSNAGSSCGISKVRNREELIEGLLEAIKHDRKILVEEAIAGREIECAVLGGNEPRASGVGEIIAAADFYDYDAKYNNEETKTILSPHLPKEMIGTVREHAVRIFKAVDGYGLSRVDFFVNDESGEVIFNEINTLPGFTSISMYPMLWEARGIGKPQLVEKLLQLAFTRAKEQEES